MRQSPIITFAVLLSCLCMHLNKVEAQSPKGAIISRKTESAGTTYAVIMGVSDYNNLPKLNYADKDATVFYEYLRNHLPAKDSNNIVLLTNKQVTRMSVIVKFNEIKRKVKEGDKIFVFFSGHGDTEDLIHTDNSLLLLSESPAKDYLEGVNSHLDAYLLKSYFTTWTEKNAKVIFVCDACRAGGLVGGEDGKKNTIQGLQKSWSNEIKILSCQANELSLESSKWGQGRGLFSYFFVLGLKGLADKENNNMVSLFELESYLKEQVWDASKHSQMPVILGDSKTIITEVDPKSVAQARNEVKTNTTVTTEDIASRGGRGFDFELSKLDEMSLQLFLAFQQRLAQGVLVEDPNQTAAFDVFKVFERRNGNSEVTNFMRLALINAIFNSFNNILTYFYNDQYDKFDLFEKNKIEKQLRACLDLAANNKILLDKTNASLSFLEACELTIGLLPGSNDYFTREKLKKGIDLLISAIAIDSLSPYLYLRLGDYYLYTNQIDKSINAYLIYQKMLPNDEFSYNKLGLAYVSRGRKDLAIKAFQTSIRLNPSYWPASENLKVLLKK